MDTDPVAEIVDTHAGERGALISILEDVQAAFGYLPADALRTVAERTGRPLVDVYGVATFYRAFSLKPRGKHLCTVCLGTACHVRGAPLVAEEAEKHLGIAPGETTPDKAITLETVNCLGACALGPIVVVDGQYFSRVTRATVKDVIERGCSGAERVDLASDLRYFPIDVACPRCNHSLMDVASPIDGHPSIRVLAALDHRHLWLNLSGVSGRFTYRASDDVPAGTVVELFCPSCQGVLRGASPCLECHAPRAPLLVRGGAMLQLCTRLGCHGHSLDVSGLNG